MIFFFGNNVIQPSWTLILLCWDESKTYFKEEVDRFKIKEGVACVASFSNRVMVRKLEWEQKKGGGKGEEETLARKPHDSGKRPLIFHGSVHL